MVLVKGKGRIAMGQLQVGDFVETSKGFSRVFSFSHRDHEKSEEFVKIVSDQGSAELTSDHLLFSNGLLARAGDVQVGDRLDKNNRVVDVKKVHRRGLFAPLTDSGELVVSGIRSSCYVAVLDIDLSMQVMMYQAMLFPMRSICRFNTALCEAETYTNGISDKFHSFLELGRIVQEMNSHLQLILAVLCWPILTFSVNTIWLFSSPSHWFSALALAVYTCYKILSLSKSSKAKCESTKPE